MGSAPPQGITSVRRRLAGLAAVVLAALACAAAPAQAATLFGTVAFQAGGQPPTPAANALVTVLDPDTGATVAFGTTDAAGAYELTLPAGTYDVRVEPGLGAGAPTTIAGVAVDTTRRLDVVLVPGGVVRVGGVLRGPNGPIAGAGMSLGGAHGIAASTSTAPDGSWSMAVAPGEYELRAQLGGFRTIGPPELPRVWSAVSERFALAADRTVDLTLPSSSPVTVRVLDENGGPIEDATVRLPTYELTGGLVADGLAFPRVTSQAFGMATDASGEARTLMFDGSVPPDGATGSVESPDGSGYPETAFTPPPVGGTATVVVDTSATVRVSGVVRGPSGPIPQAGVGLHDSTTGIQVVGRTAADGSYALDVAPGEYQLTTSVGFRGVVLPDMPRTWQIESERFAVTANRTVDLTLPASSCVSVRVLGALDEPLAGVEVGVPAYDLVGGLVTGGLAFPEVSSQGLGGATTDANGEVCIRIFEGSAPRPDSPGTITPPLGSGYGVAEFAPPTFVGGAAVVVHPPRTVRVTGVVRGPSSPVAGAGVSVADASSAGPGARARTAADGSYALELVPGEYRLSASFSSFRATGPADLPRSWHVESEDFELSGDRTVNLNLPASSLLTVRVLGDDDRPVAGAEVGLPGYGLVGGLVAGDLAFPTVSSSGAVGATDANGEVRARIFRGSVPRDLPTPPLVVPPPGSGYAPAAFTPPPVDGDALLVVRFAPLDITPPIVSCDPPPAGWHVDEASVACTASDAGSGLADPADAAFSLSTSVGDGNEDAAAQTASRIVCDRVGTCATAGPVGPISVDRAAPRIAFSQPADGANGWWVHSPASVHVTATDLNLSSLSCTVDGSARAMTLVAGPGSLEGDLVVRGEGRHTVSCTADDALGHVAQADEPVLVDVNPPRPPLASADRPPEHAGNGGWWADAVTVTVADVGDRPLADGSPGSGVDASGVPGPFVYATSGVHVTRATVRDVAGNESNAVRLTVRVDADPPTSALACPDPVAVGSRATARWSDDDAESGLDGRAGGRLALDTSTPGTFTVEHVATDRVGHVATSSCSYVVVAS